MIFALAACMSAKKLSRMAQLLEQQQRPREASQYYMQALELNPNRVEARLGLQRTGEQLFNEQLTKGMRAHEEGNHRQAVYDYMEAMRLSAQLRYYNVQLAMPISHEQRFEASRSAYLSQLYNQGMTALLDERFAEAEDIFREIHSIDPDYRDVKELKATSINEPLYRQANQLMNQDNYKQAFLLFDQIFQRYPQYRDVASLREYCRQRAAMTLALLPFRAVQSQYNSYAESLRGRLMHRLTAEKHPLIEVVDRDNIEAILREQQLAMTGAVNENTSAQAGRLMGVKAVINARITQLNAQQSPLRQEEKIAYEAFQVRVLDTVENKHKTETRYRKVTYREFTRDKQISLSVQYFLVSSETGRVLHSDVITLNTQDKVHYATYQGDFRRLHPPASDDEADVRRGNIQGLQQLFEARRELKSDADLIEPMLDQVARRISRQLTDYVQNSWPGQ